VSLPTKADRLRLTINNIDRTRPKLADQKKMFSIEKVVVILLKGPYFSFLPQCGALSEQYDVNEN